MSLSRFLSGRLLLRAECAAPERLLTRLTQAGIPLREIRIDSDTVLRFTLCAADLPKLHRALRGLHCRIRILRKSGAGRHLRAYLHRPFFVGGAVLAAGLIWFCTSIVWNVQITAGGADDIAMLDHLAQLGLSPGVRASAVTEEQLKEDLITRMPELAWVGIRKQGATVKVEYRLREMAPEIIPMELPCSVYAAKTGILTALYAYSGQKIAAVGTTVKAGDLLVSAEVPIGTDRTMLVHAIATAEARTWTETEARSTDTVEKKRYSGREITVVWLQSKNYRIKLSADTGKTDRRYGIIEGEYELTAETKPLGFLPVSVVTEHYRFYTAEPEQTDSQTEQTRMEEALQAALLTQMKNGQIAEAEFAFTAEDGACRLRMKAECREDIARTGAYLPGR